MQETLPPAPPWTVDPCWLSQPLDAAVAQLQLPAPLTPLEPAACKKLALLVAYRGLGNVAPNPLVGAVLVDKDHRFIAAGAHERVGHAHAEIMAFAAAAKAGLTAALAGGTMYVTLEPCAHASRTPACAPVVAASGLKRVVYGIVDPNPLVAGRGAALVAQAGVKVELATDWQDECRELAEVFLWNLTKRGPFIGLKAAASLDGVVATAGAQRRWITGPRARAYGHFLRCYYDAIAIGCSTLIADDPHLDTRDALVTGRAPLRVVFDPHGRGLRQWPKAGWRLLQGEPQRVLWLTGPKVDSALQPTLQAFCRNGGDHLALPLGEGGGFAGRDLGAALTAKGITSMLLEGGAGLYSAFLAAGMVQRLHLFQAPVLIGGEDSLHLVGKKPSPQLSSQPLRRLRLTPLAPDLLMEGCWSEPDTLAESSPSKLK